MTTNELIKNINLRTEYILLDMESRLLTDAKNFLDKRISHKQWQDALKYSHKVAKEEIILMTTTALQLAFKGDLK